MISAFAISQILIGIAFLFAVASFQFKAREHILVCFFALTLFIAAHYYFLEEFTAMWLALFGSLRMISKTLTL